MTITITNDDGTTQVFVPQTETPAVVPETIAIPLDTEIKIVAR